MISVNEALDLIRQQCHPLPPIKIPLENALHFVSAEIIYAPIDVPLFDNSAMDGYAVCHKDVENKVPIKVVYEINAGKNHLPVIQKGEAARIFTGAPIPTGADTVVQQEICHEKNGVLTFLQSFSKGTHIRKQGTQTGKNTLVLPKNTRLTAEYIGFLATLGIDSVKVYPKPKVGIIVTGNELVAAGKSLQNGQIYESNSITLKVLLKELGIDVTFSRWIDDNEEELYQFVNENSTKVDVLLFTGGISVGHYDFVKPVLSRLNATDFFYKVKQKPGKPLYFGKHGSTLVFALPGNPAAVVSCYHVYVKPALQLILNKPVTQNHYGILINSYYKKAGLTHYLKAFVENKKVSLLNNQLSYQMDAYAQANAIAVLTEEQENFPIGEKVKVIYFKTEN